MESAVEFKNQRVNAGTSAVQAAHFTSSQEAAERLRELGQRVTMQRVAVLTGFAEGEHLTADEVFERLSSLSMNADRSTIYRVLEHFRDLGLVSETDLGDGVRSYELLGLERHHHLVCLDCKVVVELDDEIVAPLRQAIEDRYQFKTRLDHLAVFGLCAHCADQREPDKNVAAIGSKQSGGEFAPETRRA